MKRVLGLALLVAAIAGVAAYSYFSQRPLEVGSLPTLPRMPWQAQYEAVALRGRVSAEKAGFLRDSRVQAILRDRYAISLDFTTAGSLEMVSGNTDGLDFLWPSGQLALETYRGRNLPLARDAVIFNSPLVLYSWDVVVASLEREGIARREEAGYHSADLPRLVGYAVDGATWANLGLPQLYGQVRFATTDPKRSASGNQFAGLLAVTLNGGVMVDRGSAAQHLPAIGKVFTGAGLLARNSADLFSQYIQQGVGAYPLVVGYESQLLEYAAQNGQRLPSIAEKVRLLYPRPTVWSSHPLIAVNPAAERLILALQDPEVQRLAWTGHGFRTGLAGTETGEATPAAQALGVAPSVEAVAPLPPAAIMDEITASLGR